MSGCGGSQLQRGLAYFCGEDVVGLVWDTSEEEGRAIETCRSAGVERLLDDMKHAKCM